MRLPPLLPRAPCLGLAVAACVGIALADWSAFALWPPFVIAGAVVLLLLFRPRMWLCCAAVAATFCALHTAGYIHGEVNGLASRIGDGRRLARVEGVVASEPVKPRNWSRSVTSRFLVRVESVEFSGKKEQWDAFLQTAWAGEAPVFGDRVRFTASLEKIAPPRNPGEFNWAGYQRRKGVAAEAATRFASDCQIIGHNAGNPLQKFAYASQHWIQRTLELDLGDSPQISSLIESMVLGMQGDTPEEMKSLFQRTGTMHLFAVSGLNIAMLAAIALALLKPMRVPRGLAAAIVIPILIAYAIITGLSASCVRAMVMGSMLLLSRVLDRPGSVYNGLGASALIILAWDTNQIFSPGFQFSFVLVLVIVALARPLERSIARLFHPDPFLPRQLWTFPLRTGVWIWGGIAACLGMGCASWLGSVLFTAGYFHLFSPASVVVNLLAIPLSFLILTLGVASVLVGWIAPSVAMLFNNANWFCAKTLLWMLQIFAGLPGSYLYVELPHARETPQCEITVLDVGGGGAIHFRAEGHDWMVDCGRAYEYERVVLPYLRSRGIDQLDGIFLTHGNTGYIGGMVPLLDDFQPGVIHDSPLKDRSTTRKTIHATLASREIGKRIIQAGDTVALSPHTTLRVLYPPAGLARSKAADKAFVFLCESGGRRVLLMSDNGFLTEQWLLEHEADLHADVLIKGQHGKDLSGTPGFISRVNPAAIICAPPDASGREAFETWCGGIQNRGIPLFRQDWTGAVRIEMRESGMTVEGCVNGQIFRSRAR